MCLWMRQQYRFHEGIDYGRGAQGEQHQQQKTVAQYFAGTFAVALSQRDGGQRRATAADDRRERRDQDDDGRRDADTGQRVGSDAGNVADIDPVHHVVEQVDELRRDGRQSHSENERKQIFLSESFFIAEISVVHSSQDNFWRKMFIV